MIRQSIRIGSLPPSLSRRRSCSTRNSLTCKASGMLSISSRKTVPPLAYSSFPMRRFTALVKAPASWPKISLSNTLSGSAAQLIATKGPVRPLAPCRCRATTSFPVPVWPLISTSAGVGPTERIIFRTRSIAVDWPINAGMSGWEAHAAFRRRFSITRRRFSCARLTVSSRRSAANGFSMKS